MARRYAPSARDMRHFAAGIGAALAVWLVPVSAWLWVVGAGVIVYGMYTVLRVRFPRASTRVFILWTLLCAVPVCLLIVSRGDTSLGETMASGLADIWITVIFVVWLPVALLILWLRDRRPRPPN
jgi:hypothetical protein